MSFSNPQEESQSFHPCKYWIEYKSKPKDFQYWDKEAVADDGSQGARVSLGSNPKFIFIDHTFCVSGWNNQKRFSLTSNEMKIPATKEGWANSIFKVESLPKEAMVIKFGAVSLTAIEGNWKEIKDMVDSQKGKLTINAYVAIKIKGELVLGCIKFSGGSFGPFKDFYDANKGPAIHSRVIAVTGHDTATAGDNTFNVPVFGFTDTPVKDATFNACVEMDKQLQAFLKTKAVEVPEPEYKITGTATLTSSNTADQNLKVVKKEELSDEEMFGEKVPVGNTAPPLTAADEPSIDELDDDEFEEIPF